MGSGVSSAVSAPSSVWGWVSSAADSAVSKLADPPNPFVQRERSGEVVALIFGIKNREWLRPYGGRFVSPPIRAAVAEAGFEIVGTHRDLYIMTDRTEETTTSACKRLLAAGICDQPHEFCRLKAVPTEGKDWVKYVFPHFLAPSMYVSKSVY